jgi:CspA family cold shock protein
MTSVYRLILAAILAILAAIAIQITNSEQGFNISNLQPLTVAILFIALAIGIFASPFMEELGSFSSNREKGKVKWFNISKGYGFVTRENGEDIFVHFRSIRGRGRRSLFEGQEVEFIVTEGEKGQQAEDVRPLGKKS